MGGPEAAGEGVSLDTSVPHIARVYDYWLGGKDNFAVDRAARLWRDRAQTMTGRPKQG